MKTSLVALVAASSFCLTDGYAAWVATFNGTITGFTSSGPLAGVSISDPFTFEVYFDLSPTVSSNNGTYVNNIYVPPTSAAYWWSGEGYSMSASFGAYSITTTDNTTFDVRNSVVFSGPLYQSGFAIYNAASFTSGGYSAGGGAGSLSVGLFSTRSQPQTGVVFADAALESVVDYPVSEFNQNAFRVVGTFDGVSGDINGQITSYHIIAVPEPSTPLFGLVGFVGLLIRRRNQQIAP